MAPAIAGRWAEQINSPCTFGLRLPEVHRAGYPRLRAVALPGLLAPACDRRRIDLQKEKQSAAVGCAFAHGRKRWKQWD